MELRGVTYRLLNDAISKSYFTASNDWVKANLNLRPLPRNVFIIVRYCCSQYSDSPRDGRAGDQIPLWARFSVPVQTGPGTHPASGTAVTVSFQWVKRPGCGVDHPTYLASKLKKV
jgi:hypothetical protein